MIAKLKEIGPAVLIIMAAAQKLGYLGTGPSSPEFLKPTPPKT